MTGLLDRVSLAMRSIQVHSLAVRASDSGWAYQSHHRSKFGANSVIVSRVHCLKDLLTEDPFDDLCTFDSRQFEVESLELVGKRIVFDSELMKHRGV